MQCSFNHGIKFARAQFLFEAFVGVARRPIVVMFRRARLSIFVRSRTTIEKTFVFAFAIDIQAVQTKFRQISRVVKTRIGPLIAVLIHTAVRQVFVLQRGRGPALVPFLPAARARLAAEDGVERQVWRQRLCRTFAQLRIIGPIAFAEECAVKQMRARSFAPRVAQPFTNSDVVQLFVISVNKRHGVVESDGHDSGASRILSRCAFVETNKDQLAHVVRALRLFGVVQRRRHGAVHHQQLTTQRVLQVAVLNDGLDGCGELDARLFEARQRVHGGVTVGRAVFGRQRHLEQQHFLFSAAVLAEQRHEMLSRLLWQLVFLVEQIVFFRLSGQHATNAGEGCVALWRL
mmetsp:Transcript_12416/g.20927  ORF Transcript_12416/g.20927 Transcript_12416/m.20927 type:complete len:346 (-) Transcript_12416:1293-2330(-)